MRVLVVDDEPVILTLLAAFLGESSPGGILLARSGAEALVAAQGAPDLDVILLDKNLPDGSGLELVRDLRARAIHAEIILMTGYGSMQSAVEAVTLRLFDYVTKPFQDMATIGLKISNAAAKAQAARESARLHLELVQSEERYRQLFSASSDAIVVMTNDRRRILDANAAAERLWGRTLSELLSCDPDVLRAETDHEPSPRGGGIVRRTMRRSDGALVVVEATRAPCVVHGVPAVVEILRDVTERERASQVAHDLEARALQSQRMEALGRLTGGVAHDFNNLLSVILSGVDFVKSQQRVPHDPSATAGDLEHIAEASRGAARLTKQLLAFSRREPASPTVLDLGAVTSQLLGLLRRAVPEEIELVCEPVGSPRCVKIDRAHLEQVITNLIVNARDAMPRGGTLTVTTGATELDGVAYAELRVEDTGGGVPVALRERIFEPFFTTKEEAGGTGLGLSTARAIVAQAGGTIDLERSDARGAVFRMLLPVALELPTEPLARAHTPPPLGTPGTVLVVEDDANVLGALRRILVAAGYSVLEAGSPREALQLCSDITRQIDLVLTDVVMPQMSGRDLSDRVTRLRPEIRVLFTSGYSREEMVRRGVGGDTENFLPKPFTQDEVLESVRHALATGPR